MPFSRDRSGQVSLDCILNSGGFFPAGAGDPQAVIVHLREQGAAAADRQVRSPASAVAEAESLARAAGSRVAFSRIFPLRGQRAATLLSRGQLLSLRDGICEHGVGLAIFNCQLSPGRQRNLENALGVRVIDRTGLILEIFRRRARSHEGRLQVEMARLVYQRSRLVRSWTHLERQRGGFGFLGGPGESQVEMDRRLIDDRIRQIRKGLDRVLQTRRLQRRRRQGGHERTVALVGYTNAGKSSLFNRLTGGNVPAPDLLFATLDPSLRRMALPGRRTAILSDTVGFVSDLPPELVAAFRATLEETMSADLILHVRDIAHEDTAIQAADVRGILSSLSTGPEGPDIIEVWNKVDLLPPQARRQAGESGMAVSALSGAGCDLLLSRIAGALFSRGRVSRFLVPAPEGEGLAWLHARCEILDIHQEPDDSLAVSCRMSEADRGRFRSRFPGIREQQLAEDTCV